MLMSLRPGLAALLLVLHGGVFAADAKLSLAEAERRALEYDAGVRAVQSEARAKREEAIAEGQLPDPALTIGAEAVPVDSWSLTAEDMTQVVVGVSQAFPPGDTLRHQSARATRLAEAADAEAAARAREVLRDVRMAWLELAYQDAALAQLGVTTKTFDDIVGITKSLYRTGRNNLQDVLSAQLERALLDDRKAELSAERAAALAELQRWTGPFAQDVGVATDVPVLAAPPERETLRAQLQAHPMVQAESQRVAAGQSAVEAARQSYKPGWMVDVSYGDRRGRMADGERRSDMMTAMVTLDLPLFPGQRQDRRVAASVAEADAMRFRRDEAYRDLLRTLDTEYARWEQLRTREQGYEKSIVPAARNNAEAALNAYRNSVTDFSALMRAQIAELDTRLQALRTRTERLLAQVRLLYLAGDQS